jgi:uncharacterized protein (UPF0332 family)
MKASEFIEFASKLAAGDDTSASSLRSSSSRAYYGAFHVAKQFLRSLDETFRCRNRNNEHQFVQHHLIYCDVPHVSELGRLLSNLHEKRKDADYHLDQLECESNEYAQYCVNVAVKIRDELNNVAKIPNMRSSVTLGISKYREKLNIM